MLFYVELKIIEVYTGEIISTFIPILLSDLFLVYHCKLQRTEKHIKGPREQTISWVPWNFYRVS